MQHSLTWYTTSTSWFQVCFIFGKIKVRKEIRDNIFNKKEIPDQARPVFLGVEVLGVRVLGVKVLGAEILGVEVRGVEVRGVFRGRVRLGWSLESCPGNFSNDILIGPSPGVEFDKKCKRRPVDLKYFINSATLTYLFDIWYLHGQHSQGRMVLNSGRQIFFGLHILYLLLMNLKYKYPLI